ncbi:hypothetical protein L3i22_011300 [Actinoplanes sp. L3-i22]|nr:hypothetical protein L3i22_011300 [Actinoplanes sp. L3-i22]
MIWKEGALGPPLSSLPEKNGYGVTTLTGTMSAGLVGSPGSLVGGVGGSDPSSSPVGSVLGSAGGVLGSAEPVGSVETGADGLIDADGETEGEALADGDGLLLVVTAAADGVIQSRAGPVESSDSSPAP